MATRILHRGTSLTASQADKELTPSLKPPQGLKWTIVELRPAMGAKGFILGKFDTEEYHKMHYNVDNKYLKPLVVALDVAAPHEYHLFATDESAAANTADIEVVVEETLLTPPA